MNTRTSPASSPRSGNRQSYSILGDLKVEVEVTGNPLGIPLPALFGMAARINKKRSFLFVSKVLGKHIPVNPHVSLLAGAALGLLYRQETGGDLPVGLDELVRAFENPGEAAGVYERLRASRMELPERTLFIGFAETATALGHSMFDVFGEGASFLHTTRELLPERRSCIDFEEEHSHATAHRCYAEDPQLFERAERIVLVDDEMTTGKTSLNIIADLKARWGKTEFVIASLLDWRSADDLARYRAFEAEHGVRIACLSLVAGHIAVTGSPGLPEPAESGEAPPPSGGPAGAAFMREAAAASAGRAGAEGGDAILREAARQAAGTPAGDAGGGRPDAGTSRPGDILADALDLSAFFALLPAEGASPAAPYLTHTGRFGMTAADGRLLDEETAAAAAFLATRRSGGRALVMGTGEFMYIPMRIAAGMGGDVYYQSTTRSPIHPGDARDYAVNSAWRYRSPEHPDVPNFLYNVPEGRYDELFLLMERQMPEAAMAELKGTLLSLGIPHVHLVNCSTVEGGRLE